MGKCRFCHKPAGWFSTYHEECARRNAERLAEEAKKRAVLDPMTEIVASAVFARSSWPDLRTKLRSSPGLGSLDAWPRTMFVEEALVSGWEKVVHSAIEVSDGILGEDDEGTLLDFVKSLDVSMTQLTDPLFANHRARETGARESAFLRLRQSAVLRALVAGILPPEQSLPPDVPVRLLRDEHVLWLFPWVECAEARTLRSYRGSSHGMSVRVGKGVWLRFSDFEGEPAEHTQRQYLDSGPMVVTTRHVYFAGEEKSFRLAHEKLVSVIPLTDGVTLHREPMGTTPIVMVTGDGWFTFNLLMNAGNV